MFYSPFKGDNSYLFTNQVQIGVDFPVTERAHAY